MEPGTQSGPDESFVGVIVDVAPPSNGKIFVEKKKKV